FDQLPRLEGLLEVGAGSLALRPLAGQAGTPEDAGDEDEGNVLLLQVLRHLVADDVGKEDVDHRRRGRPLLDGRDRLASTVDHPAPIAGSLEELAEERGKLLVVVDDEDLGCVHLPGLYPRPGEVSIAPAPEAFG